MPRIIPLLDRARSRRRLLSAGPDRGSAVPSSLLLLAAACIVVLAAAVARPQSPGDFADEAPIFYRGPADDPVARLERRLRDSGAVLDLGAGDDRRSIERLLSALDVPLSSQVLVFSKTSFQAPRITPRRPRAIWFSDDVFIGWVPGSDIVEISAVDPRQGAMFYVLERSAAGPARLDRRVDDCLQCHSSTMTAGIPGHLVRSVWPDDSGFPILRRGTVLVDHSTPIADRWGGWYVTGATGGAHRGNRTFSERDPDPPDLAGADRGSLDALCDTAAYPSPHSDAVALLVLEHQTKGLNLITSAGWEARLALWQDDDMDRALGRPESAESDSTRGRIERAADSLLRYFLFAGEAPLPSRVRGTSGFAAEFQARGKRDPLGRSLRDLDLERRLSKYPLSWLVETPAFAALPAPVLRQFSRRLVRVLDGEERGAAFAHLSADDRRAIREILAATQPELLGGAEIPREGTPRAETPRRASL